MTTLNTQVDQSAGDGWQFGITGIMDITSSTLSALGSSYWMATRFPVVVPAGAIVTAAALTVNVTSTSTDDPNFNIYAQLSSNAPVLTLTGNDISDRTKTAAFVNWAATGIGTGLKSSGDLSAVIQEVVDAGGINGGLMIILDGLTGVNFVVTSYNGNPALAASLSITYLIPAFVIDSSLTFHGVQANWERAPKRKNNDGTIEYQPYALHTWDIPQVEMSTFLSLQALQGQRLTSLQTTDIDSRNSPATYANAEIIGMVNARQEGRRATGVRVTFRVDVS